ncbi:hypothetical protein Tco_0394553 [Tanacetum coccineum]
MFLVFLHLFMQRDITHALPCDKKVAKKNRTPIEVLETMPEWIYVISNMGVRHCQGYCIGPGLRARVGPKCHDRGPDRNRIFDANADDGYLLGYSRVTLKPSRMDPSRQYHIDYVNLPYYIIPHCPRYNSGRSLIELTQEKHVPKVIALSEQSNPQIEDVVGPPGPSNTEETQENQNEQINHQLIKETSRNNTETLVPITESLVLEVIQSHQASTSSHHAPQDRWSKDQYIELVNIIGDPCEGMITRSIAAKLIVASSCECLFADFLSTKLDLAGKPVNETLYRGMIGSLVYLTVTRPDIQFSTVLCARYQSNPKESHLIAVKRILRYPKGTPSFGIYYQKCSGFDLKGYSNYAGCNMERKAPQVPAKYLVEN